MALYAYSQVIVWETAPGGTLRTLRGGTVTVRHGDTDAVLFTVTADEHGQVAFTTTDVPTVTLESPSGLRRRVTSQDAVEAAATFVVSEDAGVAGLVGSTTSATRAQLDGLYVAKGSLVINARDYGAVADGVADDTAAIQSAVNAAETAGGGVVFLRSGNHKTTSTILLPSNVRLAGVNSGGQVGGASRITYAGAAGGVVIGPKIRTVDTINIGISGVQINGGGLAGIVVEFYRVSYSRIQDCAIYGAQAATGVGVVFDANVSNQCYFNAADGNKVDGCPVGVRFRNGANANRWEGGKIGNGGTGIEFLTISSGNLVSGTDLEQATAKHIYIDAPSNVFVGVHLEAAPVGFDITANGSGTRRFGSTIASTVTTFIADLSTNGASLDAITTDTYELQVGATKVTSKLLSTSTQTNVDPKPFDGAASVLINWLRNVTTTGARHLRIYKGDGTATSSFLFDAGTATLSVGDVGLGGGAGGVGIANRSTAPATNPAAGGFLYAEAGALKYKGSAGTVTTIAPA